MGGTPVPPDANTGGTQATGGTPMLRWEEMSWQERAEVMEEYRAWCREQEWGPNAGGSQNGQDARTTREQFAAMAAKMRELGVPVKRN